MGDITVRVREAFRSGRRLAVRVIADEVNMNCENVRLIRTEELDEKNLCQDGAKESHRETAGRAVECWY